MTRKWLEKEGPNFNKEIGAEKEEKKLLKSEDPHSTSKLVGKAAKVGAAKALNH